jgi:uncharacterized protein (DUF1697 family)
MENKIGILRGINVGGKRKILMADLKSLCEKLGLNNVATYIQSGNLIFASGKQNSELESILEKGIKETFGFDVPVIVRSSKELDASIKNNPFYDENADINSLHLTFLKEKPTKENQEKALAFNCEPDKFKIEDKYVYILCQGKYHKTKLTNNFFEKKLNTGATTRNWKTVLKLSDLGK